MEVTVQKKEERPLLHRTDYVVRVAYEGAAPKRNTLQGSVAGTVKAPAEYVIIRQIKTEFGKQAAIVIASVYPDAATIEASEPRHMKVRHGMTVPEKKAKAKKGGKK